MKNFSLFYSKNYVLFYMEKLRTFLQGKTTYFFTGKNYVLFYREKLRTFLQGKTTYFFTGKNYKRMLLPSKEVIALSTVEEKRSSGYKHVKGIHGNVRGLEKSHR